MRVLALLVAAWRERSVASRGAYMATRTSAVVLVSVCHVVLLFLFPDPLACLLFFFPF